MEIFKTVGVISVIVLAFFGILYFIEKVVPTNESPVPDLKDVPDPSPFPEPGKDAYCIKCGNDCLLTDPGMSWDCSATTENFVCAFENVENGNCLKIDIPEIYGDQRSSVCTSDSKCSGEGQYGPYLCWSECPRGASAGTKGTISNPGSCFSCPPSV